MRIEDYLTTDEVSKYKERHAKSNGVSLYSHTQNVLNEFRDILLYRSRTTTKYLKYRDMDFSNILNLMGKVITYHDYGKLFNRWQTHLKNDSLKTVKYRHETGFLHKIKSEKEYYDEIETIIAILSHHNKMDGNPEGGRMISFNNCGDKKLLEMELFKEHSKLVNKSYNNNLANFIYHLYRMNIDDLFMDKYDLFYKIQYPRHYLQLSDRRASARESNFDPPELSYIPVNKDFYQINPNWELRNLQKICSDSKDDILILRAPTGSGKTSACLLWANNQFKNGDIERLIIAMPTQFTSNALANNIQKDFDTNVSVQHGGRRFDNLGFNDRIYSNTFENIINVCTIDQILYSFNLGKESHKSSAFNIINSCVVIDEFDFYDGFVLANIIELLKILRKYKVPVMMMSATLPNSFIELLNRELGTSYNIVDDDSDLDRIRTRIKGIHKDTSDNRNTIENLIIKSGERDQVIIYANTINNAKKYYNLLKETYKDRDDIILYHSGFTKIDKDKKEEDILKLLGHDGLGKGIIVMTQIGELSINISSNYMISEICPFDRLVQRFGRGCRFDKNICDVDIILPVNENYMDYPAPYGSLEDGMWIPDEHLSETLNRLSIGEYSGNDYLSIINDIYSNFNINDFADKNSKLLKNNFETNIIFNASYAIDEYNPEDDQIRWKSRDILQQYKIRIGIPKDIYLNKMEFDKDLYLNTVSVYRYNLERLRKMGVILIKECSVGEEIEQVYYIMDYNYLSDVGIYIDENIIGKGFEFI